MGFARVLVSGLGMFLGLLVAALLVVLCGLLVGLCSILVMLGGVLV